MGMLPLVISISNILKQCGIYGAGWSLAVNPHDLKDWVSSCRQGHRENKALSRCAPKVACAQLSCTGCTAMVQPGHGIQRKVC